MLQRIAPKDPLWGHPPFAGEETLYQLMYRLGEAEDGLFLTDRRSVLLARTSKEKPAWVWVSDSADEAAYGALREACAVHDIRALTAKPAVAARVFPRHRVSRRSLANECRCVVTPEAVRGSGVTATAEDIPDIAVMLAGFAAHVDGIETNPADYSAAAREHVQNPDTVVWFTEEGEAAAMARIGHRSPRHARVNSVFTLPAHRGNGYAGAAVAALCRRALAEGRIPMLYTDGDYPSSNRAYQKIGFVPVGELITVEKEAES